MLRKLFHLVWLITALLMLNACATGANSTNPDLPGNAFLDGRQSKVGLILCHGRGKYPTWNVVDPVRKGVHERLGYHTLSLQMPISSGDWRSYAALFPDAYARINAGIDFLVREKGVKQVYLLGHSMGSRMASSFLARYPDAKIDGFIGVGVRASGDGVLDANSNMFRFYKRLPILDIYGNANNKDVDHAEGREQMLSVKTYSRVVINGAGHRFSSHQNELVEAIVSWLAMQDQPGTTHAMSFK